MISEIKKKLLYFRRKKSSDKNGYKYTYAAHCRRTENHAHSFFFLLRKNNNIVVTMKSHIKRTNIITIIHLLTQKHTHMQQFRTNFKYDFICKKHQHLTYTHKIH